MAVVPSSVLAPNVDGVIVETTDWNNLLTFIINSIGAAIAAFVGPNAIPSSGNQPLAITPTGGLNFTIGGSALTPQYALIAAQYAASEVSQAFTVPTPDPTNPRIDLICVQAIMRTTSNVTRNIFGGGTAPIPYQYLDMQFAYVEGTASATPNAPTPPAGYQVFASLFIPANATNLPTPTIEFNSLPS